MEHTTQYSEGKNIFIWKKHGLKVDYRQNPQESYCYQERKERDNQQSKIHVTETILFCKGDQDPKNNLGN